MFAWLSLTTAVVMPLGFTRAGVRTAVAEVPCDGVVARICSENLERWNDPAARGGPERREEQLRDLMDRMVHAECDVVALQEVFGRSRQEARQTVDELARGFASRLGVPVAGSVGESEDLFIRNGFLVRSDRFDVMRERSYLDESLPRMMSRGPIARFSRAPYAVELRLRGRASVLLYLLNVHFKSKHDSFKDRTGTGFETLRMVMAEASRQLMLREAPPGAVAVLLGDRNAGESSATAAILAGERTVEDFRSGACALTDDDDHAPSCQEAPRVQRLIPLIATAARDPGSSVRGGSFTYRGKHELLDEIFAPAEQLARFHSSAGGFAVGLEGRFFHGSDHKMVWAEVCLAP